MIRSLWVIALIGVVGLGTASADLSIIQQWPVGTFPGGVAYDSERDHIWIVNEGSQEVWEYTREGGLVQTFSVAGLGILQPIGIDFDPVTGNLWIGEEGQPEGAFEITREGVLMSYFSADAYVDDVSGLAYNAALDQVYLADDNGAQVVVFSGDGAYLSSWSSAPVSDADAITYSDNTNTLLVGDDTASLIVEFTLDGTALQSWNVESLLGIGSVEGLSDDPGAGTVFIADSGTVDTVWEVAGFFPPTPVNESTWGEVKAQFK